jgi:hypothetical protein
MFFSQVFSSGNFVFKLLNGSVEVTGIKTHNVLENIFYSCFVFTENMLFLVFKAHI